MPEEAAKISVKLFGTDSDMPGICRITAGIISRNFPKTLREYSVGVLLAVAPLAKSNDGAVLFPARMHTLFRDIKGVYAYMNENRSHSHSYGELYGAENDSEYENTKSFLDDIQRPCKSRYARAKCKHENFGYDFVADRRCYGIKPCFCYAFI